MTEEPKPFGPYGLIKEIGHGGSAHVYSARAPDGSLVAVKVFDLGKQAGHGSAIRAFFENELAVVRSLNHPNIVKYLQADVIDGVPYVAMELLSGGSLEEKIRRSDYLPVDDVIAMVTPLASALDHAFSRRVLHRDIKPSNILFGADGRPVLSDFGIARFAAPRQDTRPMRFASEPPGTLDFMAPELALEAPASPASDIYSLGMTVYFSLCGQLPTDGKTIYTRTRDRVDGRLIPLTVRNPNIPTAVSDAVARVLSGNPTARFPSAQAFASALTVARLEPAGGGPARPTKERETGETKKNWLDYWRYILVPLLIALIGALAAWLGSKK